MVEQIAANIATHTGHPETLADVSQTVYTHLLTYPAERIEAMWAKGELLFWIAAVTRNQYIDGPMARALRTFSRRTEPLYDRWGEERFTTDGK